MQSGGPEPHSFIIKIWIGVDSPEYGAEYGSWRGQITHVPGGERRHIHRLEEILEFISQFLPLTPPPSRPRWWQALRVFWRRQS